MILLEVVDDDVDDVDDDVGDVDDNKAAISS